MVNHGSPGHPLPHSWAPTDFYLRTLGSRYGLALGARDLYQKAAFPKSWGPVSQATQQSLLSSFNGWQPRMKAQDPDGTLYPLTETGNTTPGTLLCGYIRDYA